MVASLTVNIDMHFTLLQMSMPDTYPSEDLVGFYSREEVRLTYYMFI